MQRNSAVSITPRTSYYRPDGSGRDTYISFDNGGCNAPMTFHPHSATPKASAAVRPHSAVSRSSARSLHYYSDGSGRDKYIKQGDGGLHLDYPDVSASQQFVTSLREPTPTSGKTVKAGDYFEWAQRAWTPKRARLHSQDRKRRTDDCVRRLTASRHTPFPAFPHFP